MPTPPLLTADLGAGVLAAFTCREGGVSDGPYASLNLGLHVGDDPGAVLRNRAQLEEAAAVPVRIARQVHGTRVLSVAPPTAGAVDEALQDAAQAGADLGGSQGADALLAARPGVGVAVLVADCVPVLLADSSAAVIAAAHAGRVGLLAGVLQRTVAAMLDAGARLERIRAVVGPAAGPCCYEVPQAMQDDACARLPELRASTRSGTPALDLRAGCRSVLEAAGIGAVEPVGGCTIDDEAFFSYRRRQVTGRFAGLVAMPA